MARKTQKKFGPCACGQPGVKKMGGDNVCERCDGLEKKMGYTHADYGGRVGRRPARSGPMELAEVA